MSPAKMKMNENLIQYLEKEKENLKSICSEQQSEITDLNKKLVKDKSNYEHLLNNLKNAYDDKQEELTGLYKNLKKLEKTLTRKQEEINNLKNLINETKTSFQNEISMKNEEIYELKNACDKMLSRVYTNMEKALYN